MCVAHGFITFYFLIFYRWSICIDIYEYGMLTMGFDCCLEEISFQSFEGTELD